MLRPPLATSEYEYKNIFVSVTVNWSGFFEFFYYEYENVFVGRLFSPRTDVVFVFSEYANENKFVLVFFILPHQFVSTNTSTDTEIELLRGRKGDADTDRTSSWPELLHGQNFFVAKPKGRYRSIIFRKGDTDTDRTSSWPELLRGQTEREIQIENFLKGRYRYK